MNASNAHLYLPLVKALAEGKTIQIKCSGIGWADYPDCTFNLSPDTYRIKPEPRRWWIVKKSEHDHFVAFTQEGAAAMKKEMTFLGYSNIEIIEVQEVMK